MTDPHILVFREGEEYFWCSINRQGIRGRKNGPHPTRESVMEVARFAAEMMKGWAVRVDGDC